MKVSYELRKPKVNFNSGLLLAFRVWHGKGWGGFDFRFFNLKLMVTYGGTR